VPGGRAELPAPFGSSAPSTPPAADYAAKSAPVVSPVVLAALEAKHLLLSPLEIDGILFAWNCEGEEGMYCVADLVMRLGRVLAYLWMAIKRQEVCSDAGKLSLNPSFLMY
jgi:hypothetical protein